MNIDGSNTLACLCYISKGTEPTKINPLPHMYVIKDLVPDLSNFYDQYKSIEPWLQTKVKGSHDLEHGEFMQTKEDRKKLDGILLTRSFTDINLTYLLTRRYVWMYFMRMLFNIMSIILVERW